MSEERQNKIITVLETCFSDANLLWDKLMLKNVLSNPEGFVSFESLSKLQKFKTIKATSDEIKECSKIRSLTKLKLSPDGTSIARINAYKPNKETSTDDRSIYVEGLAASYQNESKIYELFEKFVGKVSSVKIPKMRHENIKFFGFCFVEFVHQEHVKKAVELMDNNKQLTQLKLRVMTMSKWKEYEKIYLEHYEERLDQIQYLWREYHRSLKENEHTTEEERPTEHSKATHSHDWEYSGATKRRKVDDTVSYVKGVIAFVQNLHPNCPKTTAIELLQTSGVHIAYMANKKKGLDKVHIRLEKPEDAQELVAYFQENPTIQETEKDRIGKPTESHGVDTLKLRVLQGKEEELYWENDKK